MKWYVIAKEFDTDKDTLIKKVLCVTDDWANAFIFRDSYNKYFKTALIPETRAYVISETDLLNNWGGTV